MTHPYQPSEKPVAWRIRYRSEPGMIGHYPWSYTERERAIERPECDVEQLFTASQLAAEVERAVAAERERIATMVEQTTTPYRVGQLMAQSIRRSAQ
jgi:hypothetical protein